MYLSSKAVQENVNWLNELINNSGWERVIAISAVIGVIAFLIGLQRGWVTIGNKAETIYKSQLEAANISLQMMDTNALNKIDERLRKMEDIVGQVNEMLPLVRTVANEVNNIEDELRDLRRREGGGRNVI